MVSAFVTFSAVFTALIALIGVSAVVPVVLEIESPLGFLAAFWGLVIGLSLGGAKLATVFSGYRGARAVIRLGAVGAVAILGSGFLVAAAETLELPPWTVLPFAVAFGVLLIVRDDEIRGMLLGRSEAAAPPASPPRCSGLPADRQQQSLRR